MSDSSIPTNVERCSPQSSPPDPCSQGWRATPQDRSGTSKTRREQPAPMELLVDLHRSASAGNLQSVRRILESESNLADHLRQKVRCSIPNAIIVAFLSPFVNA